MPQNLPVFIRAKYHGNLEGWEDVEVCIEGVNEMRPDGKPKNVTLLV